MRNHSSASRWHLSSSSRLRFQYIIKFFLGMFRQSFFSLIFKWWALLFDLHKYFPSLKHNANFKRAPNFIRSMNHSRSSSSSWNAQTPMHLTFSLSILSFAQLLLLLTMNISLDIFNLHHFPQTKHHFKPSLQKASLLRHKKATHTWFWIYMEISVAKLYSAIIYHLPLFSWFPCACCTPIPTDTHQLRIHRKIRLRNLNLRLKSIHSTVCAFTQSFQLCKNPKKSHIPVHTRTALSLFVHYLQRAQTALQAPSRLSAHPQQSHSTASAHAHG